MDDACELELGACAVFDGGLECQPCLQVTLELSSVTRSAALVNRHPGVVAPATHMMQRSARGSQAAAFRRGVHCLCMTGGRPREPSTPLSLSVCVSVQLPA